MTTDYPYTRTEVLLEVKGLSVNYSLPILQGVDLEIRDVKRPGLTQGQKVALLGPSGIGKTQLFRCLAGLQKPTSGSILIGEEKKPVHAGMIGVVPQNYFLFPNRTVMGSLMLAAKLKNLDTKTAREKVLYLLAQFNLADKANYYPAQLSGGQRQRVSIIEQILCSNHFLLMDEPFSGLDPLMKDMVCHLIDQIAASDELSTIIMTTHDIESAIAIADTIWLLGRDHDSAGNPLPGARVQKTYDLIELNLAWHPDILHLPHFAELAREIRDEFRRL